MKIYMPSKKLIQLLLILVPIALIAIALIILGGTLNQSVLSNISTVLLLVLILMHSLGSRYIRKDNIILKSDKMMYGLKNTNNNFLVILLSQYEKASIRYKDIITYNFNQDSKIFYIHTRQGKKEIDLKYFSQKTISKILDEIKEHV
jgi:hypothetical protein